jgi:hypothetical protein
MHPFLRGIRCFADSIPDCAGLRDGWGLMVISRPNLCVQVENVENKTKYAGV